MLCCLVVGGFAVVCGLFTCCGLGCLLVGVRRLWCFVNSVVHCDFFLFVVGCLIAILIAEFFAVLLNLVSLPLVWMV